MLSDHLQKIMQRYPTNVFAGVGEHSLFVFCSAPRVGGIAGERLSLFKIGAKLLTRINIRRMGAGGDASRPGAWVCVCQQWWLPPFLPMIGAG